MFNTYFEEQTDINRTQIVTKFSEERNRILNSMESLHDYREEFNWFIGDTYLFKHNIAKTPILSALIKNEFSLYSCLRLTDLGLYGSARILLRSVFESLMIAKFASVSQSEGFIKKWRLGETIYLSNTILKKIEKPELKEINTLWGILCDYAHATIYAQQVELDFRGNAEEISLNYSIIIIFLCWSYHLLNRHFITSTMKYYTRYKGPNYNLKSIKYKARDSVVLAKETLTKASKKTIHEYVSSWRIKK